eukprot:173359-Lingulodinium_polyedra.AAC.1
MVSRAVELVDSGAGLAVGPGRAPFFVCVLSCLLLLHALLSDWDRFWCEAVCVSDAREGAT